MAQKILGMVSIPVVGGVVHISSEGRVRIDGPMGGLAAHFEVDEVTAFQIADALLQMVVPMMKARAKTLPPMLMGTSVKGRQRASAAADAFADVDQNTKPKGTD